MHRDRQAKGAARGAAMPHVGTRGARTYTPYFTMTGGGHRRRTAGHSASTPAQPRSRAAASSRGAGAGLETAEPPVLHSVVHDAQAGGVAARELLLEQAIQSFAMESSL